LYTYTYKGGIPYRKQKAALVVKSLKGWRGEESPPGACGLKLGAAARKGVRVYGLSRGEGLYTYQRKSSGSLRAQAGGCCPEGGTGMRAFQGGKFVYIPKKAMP